MKIITLLVDSAFNAEMPKKIRYKNGVDDYIYTWDEKDRIYKRYNKYGEYTSTLGLDFVLDQCLNDVVEVLEPAAPALEKIILDENDDKELCVKNKFWQDIDKSEAGILYAMKINAIIDKINEMSDKDER